VAAKDLGTNKEQSVNVVPTSGLTEHQITEIIAEAERTQADDETRKEVAELRNQAESLLYTSERALLEFGAVLNDEDRAALEHDLDDCKRLVEHGSAVQLREALLRLETSAQRIGELIYAQVKGEGEGGVGEGGVGQGGGA
jgi:molecular chaperone DnaK